MTASEKNIDHMPAPYAPEKLIEDITMDISDDNEQLQAFLRSFRENVKVPCDGFVIGEPVSVTGFDYDGNVRRGLTARCLRDDGDEYIVTASEVILSPHVGGSSYLAAYRKWLGVEPYPSTLVAGTHRRRHKVDPSDLDLSGPIELIVLSVKKTTARCRLPGSDRSITLRASELWDVFPGEIIMVNPGKQWSYAGHPYLSGKIESARLDVEALDLIPLRLEEMGIWDPSDHYWGEDDEPIADWAIPIIARGPRPAFEMEQVVPGMDYDELFSSPIIKSNDCKDAGDIKGADRFLMDLCQVDLRCLDAHAHLGNLVFDHTAEDAIRHYEIGFRIGELSLGKVFKDLLPWGHIDNRPFLRCMHGYGLCLWRLGRFEEAEEIFNRMLWLNPTDNLGVRFLLPALRSRKTWENYSEER